VDWSPLASGPLLLYPVAYLLVVKNSIPIVAQRVADFIGFLRANNYTTPNKIHVVGHSLGAHVSGLTGKLVQEGVYSNNDTQTLNKIGRISGLDPAGPLFDGIEVQRKLRPEDALFVDVYHTAIGTRGDSSLSGHVDFYRMSFGSMMICLIIRKGIID
jgi:pimeloyl-ACP methyl ester carboxylesterase